MVLVMLTFASAAVILSTRHIRHEELMPYESDKTSSQDINSFFDSLSPVHAPRKSAHQVKVPYESAKTSSQDMRAYFDHPPSKSDLRTNLKRARTRWIQKEALQSKKELKVYKIINPSFKKRLDRVHETWLSRHNNLPVTMAQKKKYDHLVAKVMGNLGSIVRTGVEEARKDFSNTQALVQANGHQKRCWNSLCKKCWNACAETIGVCLQTPGDGPPGSLCTQVWQKKTDCVHSLKTFSVGGNGVMDRHHHFMVAAWSQCGHLHK